MRPRIVNGYLARSMLDPLGPFIQFLGATPGSERDLDAGRYETFIGRFGLVDLSRDEAQTLDSSGAKAWELVAKYPGDPAAFAIAGFGCAPDRLPLIRGSRGRRWPGVAELERLAAAHSAHLHDQAQARYQVVAARLASLLPGVA